jgi:hypothetical protein
MIEKTNSFKSICKSKFFSFTQGGYILEEGKEFTIVLNKSGESYSVYNDTIDSELIRIHHQNFYNYFHTKEQMREINLNKILKHD